MSRQINQPSNQIKLTNVSLVRLKKGKKRFEIACYKNKVLEWRSGIETDLDNVLQIPSVFLNVSKGQTAPSADLAKAFGKDVPTDDIILEILNKGELQVGERERAAQLERVHNEVVSIIASKLVNPRTKRVYTTGMIEKALDMLSQQAHQGPGDKDSKSASASASGSATPAAAENGDAKSKPTVSAAAAAAAAAAASSSSSKEYIWTGVTTTKSAKSQALEAIKALIAKQPVPVARARMRLRITCSTGVLKQAVKAPAPAAEKGKAKKGAKGGRGDDDEEEGEKKAPGTVKDKILGFVEQVENQDVVGSEWEVVGFVEPGAYKGLSDFIANETKGQGRVEVLTTITSHVDSKCVHTGFESHKSERLGVFGGSRKCRNIRHKNLDFTQLPSCEVPVDSCRNSNAFQSPQFLLFGWDTGFILSTSPVRAATPFS
ncbi:hypothetical protein FJTKL_10509 [Diaporthe vaccinii]|uniref:Shwachman-Bodian-Diamond syndrome protein n=1 Tax=Diaporthe vaccinii TaxID=105482 RepID=A0ABR4EK58_9PEZI